MKKMIKSYDDAPGKEWQRLDRDPYHRIEFMVTMHYLYKYLPRGAKILDAGGGPGRYTIELCRQGYKVVLLDISPRCIEFARNKFRDEPLKVQQRLLDARVGDVQDLSSFKNHHFDAVLCFDPLTYILQSINRKAVIKDLVRIAKPGSLVLLAVRGYLAVLRTILRISSGDLLNPKFELLLRKGDMSVRGVLCHFFRADEIKQLAESCGLKTLEMAGCEGLSSGLVEASNQLIEEKERWEKWVELVIQTSSEPAVVDMAEHILYIGQTPE